VNNNFLFLMLNRQQYTHIFPYVILLLFGVLYNVLCIYNTAKSSIERWRFDSLSVILQFSFCLTAYNIYPYCSLLYTVSACTSLLLIIYSDLHSIGLLFFKYLLSIVIEYIIYSPLVTRKITSDRVSLLLSLFVRPSPS